MSLGLPGHRVSRRRLALGWALAPCLGLAGCAGGFGAVDAPGRAHPFRDPGMSMQAAMDAIAPGKATRADVLALLGEAAAVVRFDSGFEVWVYRARPAANHPSPAEFVVLFAPAGIVRKQRIRPSYAQPGR